MNDRTTDYYELCKPSEYSEEELEYILANCGPTEDQMGAARCYDCYRHDCSGCKATGGSVCKCECTTQPKGAR